jgi:hypothetical protein
MTRTKTPASALGVQNAAARHAEPTSLHSHYKSRHPGRTAIATAMAKKTRFMWTPFATSATRARGGATEARKPPRLATGDYFLFHKYSPDGKELGAYIRRSLFAKPGLEPGMGHTGGWVVRAAKDRIGAFVYPGMVSNDPVWIELDFNGNLLGSWHTGKPTMGGHAFTANARLFRTVLVSNGPQSVHVLLDEFDRPSACWKTVDTLGFTLPEALLPDLRA